MNLDQMTSLTEGLSTKADKMRVLERAGFSRADIARFLAVRYQQVRNTLEGDKRTGYVPEFMTAEPDPRIGDAVPVTNSHFRSVSIGEDGFANLPPDLIEPFAEDEDGLFAVAMSDGIFVSSLKGMASRVRASCR